MSRHSFLAAVGSSLCIVLSAATATPPPAAPPAGARSLTPNAEDAENSVRAFIDVAATGDGNNAGSTKDEQYRSAADLLRTMMSLNLLSQGRIREARQVFGKIESDFSADVSEGMYMAAYRLTAAARFATDDRLSTLLQAILEGYRPKGPSVFSGWGYLDGTSHVDQSVSGSVSVGIMAAYSLRRCSISKSSAKLRLQLDDALGYVDAYLADMETGRRGGYTAHGLVNNKTSRGARMATTLAARLRGRAAHERWGAALEEAAEQWKQNDHSYTAE